MTTRWVEVSAVGRELLAGLVREPWGQVSASVYETGRLVSLAPTLPGHARRLDWLAGTQHTTGEWGAPDGYALVPTLSATEGLLRALYRDDPAIADMLTERGELSRSVDAGLVTLFDWFGRGRRIELPDMPAIEVIVAALIDAVNDLLDRFGTSSARLHPPAGPGSRLLTAIGARFATGAPIEVKLWHAAEVFGTAVRGSTAVVPVAGGIGASPAATAAWLGADLTDPALAPSTQYLRTTIERTGGPVPCATPITVFERSWVLGMLARAGLDLGGTDGLPELVASLRAGLDERGAATAPGLPPDADTTAATVSALNLLARGPHRYRPDVLWAYQVDDHFCTWPGEQGVSSTVNAHVLEAFGSAVADRPELAPRYRSTMDAVTGWLCARQHRDGSWHDRWHASPYYATAECVLALRAFGRPGPTVSAAVNRARGFVLDRQRADGSWGRWGGTAEETAYAVRALLAPGPAGRHHRRRHLSTVDIRSRRAVDRAHSGLVAALDQPLADGPALWHDKDLYRPHAIVRAAILAAIHAYQCDLRTHQRNEPATWVPVRRTRSLRAATGRC